MPDQKIVTKKTAAKPAAPTNASPAAGGAVTRTVVKKTAVKADSPSPAAAKPPTTKAAARPEPAKTTAKGKATAAAPKAPLEEKPVSLQHLTNVTPEQRQHMIQEAAYYRAEKRNFIGGSDAEDWAEAEREIDELMARAIQIFGA